MTGRFWIKAMTIALAALVVSARAAVAAEPKARPEQPERTTPMEYGPFLSTSVIRAKAGAKPPKNAQASADLHPDIIAHKGIAIPFGHRGADGQSKAGICFDTDTLACAVGWTGGFLNLAGTMLTNHKGTAYPQLQGAEQFHNAGPGWAVGEDFADPRPDHLGQLDPGRRYKGLYVNGQRVVLSYTVGGFEVTETPDYMPPQPGHHGAFTRAFGIKRSDQPLSVSVCDLAADDTVEVQPGGTVGIARSPGGAVTCAGAVNLDRLPKGAALKQVGRRLVLTIPPLPTGAVFALIVARDADPKAFAQMVHDLPVPANPQSLIGPGRARWTEEVVTAGKLAAPGRASGDGAYVVDELTVPEGNPWGAWMRFTGLDFFPDGRAAICTLNGDVWIVSGIDDSLGKLTWKRFAAGLYHPMGLRIVDGTVYVCGRDQITRLHDTNKDGEADFYEDFNSGTVLHPLYHAFTMDLQTDAQGNFYYARCGRSVPSDYRDHNALFRVSPDGSKSEQIAWGLRAANGMGTGPNGWLLVSDNEGEWVPSSKINLIRTDRPSPPNGEFFGSPQADYHGPFPKDFTRPLCWIPHSLDTSSGGEAYVDADRWGPYKGQWVHTSFGTASMFLLLTDEVDGAAQAATVKLPISFATGIMRPRFNPKDGQLYVAGVGGGWQTSGTADAGLYRVRYTGKPAHLPAAFHVVPHGVRLTFPTPLDRASAADDQNWAIEQWNYRWSEKYGSPDLSVKNPAKVGRDDVEVKSVQVSEDGKTVTLDIPTLKPVMQMMIQYNLKAADGTKLSQELYATINRVPAGKAP